jgi:hypothetical protein
VLETFDDQPPCKKSSPNWLLISAGTFGVALVVVGAGLIIRQRFSKAGSH